MPLGSFVPGYRSIFPPFGFFVELFIPASSSVFELTHFECPPSEEKETGISFTISSIIFLSGPIPGKSVSLQPLPLIYFASGCSDKYFLIAFWIFSFDLSP